MKIAEIRRIFYDAFTGRNNGFLLVCFMGIAVIMRLFSFWNSVLDHDESTYMIIGRDILQGKSLYSEVTDTKPVGIFLFYAGLEFLFGSSIAMKRLVFSLVVGVTAFFLYKISGRIIRQNRVAIASGLIYIFYTSVWNYHGRSPNTELLFNVCTAGALLFFLSPGYRNYFFGGLILGIGFIIKYLVLFDLLAFVLFFTILEASRTGRFLNFHLFLRGIIAGLAFSIPFGLVNLYFWLGDHFREFYFVTYELPGNYGSNPSLIRFFVMLLDLAAKFLPVSFMVLYVLVKKEKPLKREYRWFFAIWIASVMFAMYIPGKEFSHYTIQLMLPLSLLAGIFFHPGLIKDRLTRRIFSGKTGWAILAFLIVVIQTVSFVNDIVKNDYPEEVTEYLEDNLEKGEKVYVSNYAHIIYYLLGIDSPTKYVHSNLLFTDTHKSFKINARDEISRIMGIKPRYVLVYRNNRIMQGFVRKDYFLVKTFKNGEIRIYRRSD